MTRSYDKILEALHKTAGLNKTAAIAIPKINPGLGNALLTGLIGGGALGLAGNLAEGKPFRIAEPMRASVLGGTTLTGAALGRKLFGGNSKNALIGALLGGAGGLALGDSLNDSYRLETIGDFFGSRNPVML